MNHKQKVTSELRKLGVSSMGLLSMESRYLPQIIHVNEHIMGVMHGRNDEGIAMLIATDRRVIYLDKKLFFVKLDEVTYDVVSGISVSTNGVGSSVTLHTRVKDFTLRTFNKRCTEGFVAYIESRRLEKLSGEPS